MLPPPQPAHLVLRAAPACLQDVFAPVALQAMKQLAGLLPAAAAGGDLERLKALLSAVRLLCRIFFSLNSPGLTPVRGRTEHADEAQRSSSVFEAVLQRTGAPPQLSSVRNLLCLGSAPA